MKLIIDSIEYRVNVVYPTHEVNFSVLSGQNAGTAINFSDISDVAATTYTHQMQIEPDERFPADFDALVWALSAPVASHKVTLPFAQGEQEFQAKIRAGKIVDHGTQGGFRRWRGLSVSFTPITPQRTET